MTVYEDIFERPSVGGRYKFLKRLGSGAFGEVFLADQEVAGVPGVKFRQVAIKLFTQESITAGNAEKVFAEALLLEQLAEGARAKGESVHLVTIFDLGILRDYSAAPFVAMECVYGSLEKQLAAAPSLPLDTVIRHMRGICAGLELAHGHTPAIVHRDLKPANVLIEKNGFLKVADFGLAIDRHRAYLASGRAGTISYSPPESRGQGVHTPTFDVYSLGIIMLEMLAGRNPLADAVSGLGVDPLTVEKGLNAAQASLAELRDPGDGTSFPARLHQLRQSPGAQEILRRCLALDPFQRFQNAMELNTALASLEAGRPVSLGLSAVNPESGRNKVSRLLDEAAAFLKEENLTEVERRLAEVLALSPREEKYFFLLSEVREGQKRWTEAIQARKEGNAIAAFGSVGRRPNPVLIERLALLYERAGKPMAAKETRRLLEN
jgi:serine/threonine-protein kinase